jgi:hypothetical protein
LIFERRLAICNGKFVVARDRRDDCGVAPREKSTADYADATDEEELPVGGQFFACLLIRGIRAIRGQKLPRKGGP